MIYAIFYLLFHLSFVFIKFLIYLLNVMLKSMEDAANSVFFEDKDVVVRSEADIKKLIEKLDQVDKEVKEDKNPKKEEDTNKPQQNKKSQVNEAEYSWIYRRNFNENNTIYYETYDEKQIKKELKKLRKKIIKELKIENSK